MAGALSESAPRPVSVVRVDGGETVATTPASNNTNGDEPPCLDRQVTPDVAPTSDASDRQQQTPVRSFASTEAQTELSPSLLLVPSHQHHTDLLSEELRDARRRERRLRRHHRRALQRANGAAAAAAAAAAVGGSCAVSGLPPTYPGLLGAAAAGSVGGAGPACAGLAGGPVALHQPTQGGATGAVPLVGPAGPVGGFLHPPPPHLGLRGLSLGLPFPVPASVSAFGRDASPKQCCGLGSPPVRWSIFGVGVVGLVCASAGALLGGLRATGRDHIAVALLMIGIGVVLVTVSAVAWRVTSREACGGFFGLPGISGRIPPARPMHPYAAMIYPEFQFRTPPPSYQASMQEYRLRLLLLDRLQPTSSPPPTYRSNTGSYAGPAGHHQLANSSNGPSHHAPVAGVVAATHHHHQATSATNNRESRPPSYCGRQNDAGTCSLLVPSKKDANLVRIVQTESEPVILSGDQTPPVAAVEVLAHL
ncbi:uncharacterized protein LOC106637153 [Copidosoma floridanum]|uniref:uncharacterized protein LOC106637153 n=1 Tax=Copidosoma floridanum TaxID=29053 RepID=UPI0006C9D3D6|nr:uncharacterized protein LOC106637153 [Copidosoma floridanum]XP_023245568.1 uncharacterized protein LOC106637153 [Copidosoma floridanum]XP_023245569.1 uncharacterized protein LOC106637153 [Copidosoma floridanum]XP_023245570.1 uncharacterized protein LOC106637153 [Copidosoma floridanum]